MDLTESHRPVKLNTYVYPSNCTSDFVFGQGGAAIYFTEANEIRSDVKPDLAGDGVDPESISLLAAATMRLPASCTVTRLASNARQSKIDTRPV